MPIEISNLNYVYNPKSPFEKAALKDINLTIADGDFFALIGHTGSGKSTLVGHFNALIRIQSGKIVVNGMDLTPKKLDFKTLRSSVGMLFQYPEYQLFDETVLKDVSFGPKNLKLKEDEIFERSKEAIELVGLDFEKIKDRSPFEISGGQKRRVALAGVLSMRPKILVLDEPTAGLDPKGKRDILNLIKTVKEKMNLTVIMISHNMDEVAECADKIGIMHDGRLEGVMTPRELFPQKELLDKLNMKMPEVTRLACLLNENGFNIDRSILTENELVEGIVAGLKNGKKTKTKAEGGKDNA